MKRMLFLGLLVLSSSAFSGVCQLKFGSREASKLPRVEGYSERHTGVNLESCVSRAESLMGSKVVFKGTLVLPDAVRLVTEGSYSFSDSHVTASGHLNVKNF